MACSAQERSGASIGLSVVTVLCLAASLIWYVFRQNKFPLAKRRVPHLLTSCLFLANLFALVAGPLQSAIEEPNCVVMYWMYFLYFPFLTGPMLIRASVLYNQLKWSKKARSMALEELNVEQLKTLTLLRDRTSFRWSTLVFVLLLLTTSALAGLLFHFQGTHRMYYANCECVPSEADVIGSGSYSIVAAIALLYRSYHLRSERDQFGLIAEMQNIALLWFVSFSVWMVGELATPIDKRHTWTYVLLLTSLSNHIVTVIFPTISTHHGKVSRTIRKMLLFFMLCRDPLFFSAEQSRLTNLEMQYNDSQKRETYEAIPFEKLIEMPAGLSKFEEFLISEFSVENIRFWVGVRRWKAEYRNGMGRRSSYHMANAIFTNFILQGAVMQVNISDKQRRKIETTMKAYGIFAKQKATGSVLGYVDLEAAGTKKIPVDIFNAAENEIFELMKRDSFPRFKKSASYEALIAHLMYSSSLLLPLSHISEASDFASGKNEKGRPLSVGDLTKRHKRLSSRDLAPRSHSSLSSTSSDSASSKPKRSLSSGVIKSLRNVGAKGMHLARPLRRPGTKKDAPYEKFASSAEAEEGEVQLKANPMNPSRENRATSNSPKASRAADAFRSSSGGSFAEGSSMDSLQMYSKFSKKSSSNIRSIGKGRSARKKATKRTLEIKQEAADEKDDARKRSFSGSSDISVA